MTQAEIFASTHDANTTERSAVIAEAIDITKPNEIWYSFEFPDKSILTLTWRPFEGSKWQTTK